MHKPTQCIAPVLITVLILTHLTLLSPPACSQVGDTSTITTIAGSSGSGYRGDGGPAAQAQFAFAQQYRVVQVLAMDSGGNLYIVDTGNQRVRRIGSDGKITTVAGTGAQGFYGETINAAQAVLNQPASVAVDRSDRVYIADTRNGRIRRIDASGLISTFAGGGATSATSPSLIPNLGLPPVRATDVDFQNVGMLAFSPAGDLYADPLGALNGTLKISRDGVASLDCCVGLFDAGGNNYYVSDNRVYRNKAPFAGTGVAGYAGDGGPALAAQLNVPRTLAMDGGGNLYIADTGNSVIRRVAPDGKISTVAGVRQDAVGIGTGVSDGDGGPAGSAHLGDIVGMLFDKSGNLYLAERTDHFNYSNATSVVANRIRRVSALAPTGKPLIRSVVSAASYQSNIAAGSWVTIFGDNLAPIAQPGRQWRQDEFAGAQLPTTLEGVSVRINGKQAAISFISPGQLNVQAPDDATVGAVPVEVSTPAGTAAFTATLRTYAPAIFVTAPVGNAWLAAAVHTDGALVGNPIALPGARPARPGEIIMLFGTGFGTTSPPRPSGQLVSAAPLSVNPTVSIGGRSATVEYAGLVGPGLDQINIRVPTLTDGDYGLTAAIGGVETQTGVMLPVGN